MRYYEFIDSLAHGNPDQLFEIAKSYGWQQKQVEGDLTGEWVRAAKYVAERMPLAPSP